MKKHILLLISHTILIPVFFIFLCFSCFQKKHEEPPGESISLIPYKEMGQTSIFYADISHIPLKNIKTIIAKDNSTSGGSDGIYSGFDIDFLLLDTDGNFETKGDQIYPLEEEVTKVSPGIVRNKDNSIHLPSITRPGKLFGLNAGNGIDFYIATISVPDAHYEDGLDPEVCSGWLSLGDGGILYAHFGLKNVDTHPSMFLFIGEVGGGFEEQLEAVIKIVE